MHYTMNDPMAFQLHPSLQDEDFQNDIGDHHHDHDHHLNPHNLSRLSVCTSSTVCGADDDDNFDDALAVDLSGMSIESFEGEGDDADGEFSSDGSDSENELSGFCYPLNQTVKDSASDNEGQKTKKDHPRRRRIRKETCMWNSSEKNRSNIDEKEEEEHVVKGMRRESDRNGSTWVITRPKGGRRSLCMDLEEVKACKDLGFELEVPSRLSVSLSNSTLDTSSGGSSPITNWRISSPGNFSTLFS